MVGAIFCLCMFHYFLYSKTKDTGSGGVGDDDVDVDGRAGLAKKNYFMKKSGEFLILVLFFSFLQGCIDDRSKEHYKATDKIGDHLFVEVFTPFGGGAFGGDRVSEYLTDSISFRKYIGTFVDSDAGISYKVVNDTLYIEKYSSAFQKKV